MIGIDANVPESMYPLFKNTQIALIITPHDPSAGIHRDAELTRNMILAAVDSGVEHIVFVGSWTVLHKDRISEIAARFVDSEELLANLGVKCTSLRCGFFNQNLVGMFGHGIKNYGKIMFPRVYIPAVNTDDIGKSAAAIIMDQGKGHEGKCYDISGPQMLSFDSQDKETNFAEIFSNVLGKRIEYQEKRVDEFKGVVPDYLYQLFEYMSSEQQNAIPLSDDVFKLTGQHSRFSDWLIQNKKAFE
jgi:uncharacterized protein YbjT (DUF2867 family)